MCLEFGLYFAGLLKGLKSLKDLKDLKGFQPQRNDCRLTFCPLVSSQNSSKYCWFELSACDRCASVTTLLVTLVVSKPLVRATGVANCCGAYGLL